MKVQLTAFNGKLQSDIMDWPENTRPEIYMAMDMDTPKMTMDLEPSFETTLKKAKFIYAHTGYLNGGVEVKVYKLVEVN